MIPIDTEGELLAARVIVILIDGISIFHDACPIADMADIVGVFRSHVSRITIEAGGEANRTFEKRTLAEKSFHKVEPIAVRMDSSLIGQ